MCLYISSGTCAKADAVAPAGIRIQRAHSYFQVAHLYAKTKL